MFSLRTVDLLVRVCIRLRKIFHEILMYTEGFLSGIQQCLCFVGRKFIQHNNLTYMYEFALLSLDYAWMIIGL